MKKITGNDPITPTNKYFDENGESRECLGLTIRQEFAARAMEGFSKCQVIKIYGIGGKIKRFFGFEPKNHRYKISLSIQGIAKISVLMADTLIEELNKEK